MNGKVIPDTPIAVDFWQLRKCHHVRLFFLSHMHADHTSGLSSTWSHRPIYCSQITAKLLKLKLQVKEKWIRPLEIGEPHMLLLDDLGKERMTVTLIDANHCPGAVMFLFQGYFGTILYTGDFRYSPSMLREECLRNDTTIDVLYLDNTNCDPTRTIPSRQSASRQIKEIIRAHPGYTVVIGLYSLGKESLLVELAMEFKTWVEVDKDRLQTLQVLELLEVFTTEAGAGRIRAVNQTEINASNILAWNKEQPTIAILPTSRPIVSFHPNIHVVPYSDHSSYQELEEFVSALRPVSLVPIVGSCLPYFSCFLSSPNKKRKSIIIPESVQRYMNTKPNIQNSSYSMLQKASHQGSRGVVFDSPESQKNRTECDGDSDDADTDINSDSDCILLDMSSFQRESEHHRKRLKLTRVASEDVVTIGSSLPPDDNESVNSLQNNSTCSKKSPQMGSTNSRKACFSLDSISIQDQTFVADTATAEMQPVVTPMLNREQIEQWLIKNFTIPPEELKKEQTLQNLSDHRLTPVDIPKEAGDPLQAAIKRLMS